MKTNTDTNGMSAQHNTGNNFFGSLVIGLISAINPLHATIIEHALEIVAFSAVGTIASVFTKRLINFIFPSQKNSDLE